MKRIVSSGLLLPSNHRQIGAFLVKRALSSEQKREELVCIFDKKLPRNQMDLLSHNVLIEQRQMTAV